MTAEQKLERFRANLDRRMKQMNSGRRPTVIELADCVRLYLKQLDRMEAERNTE